MKDDKHKGPQLAAAPTPAPAPAATSESIQQVRDLLFGAEKRATDTRLDQLDARTEKSFAELRTEMSARFADLESRLEAATRNLDDKRMTSIEEIGAAIAALGASVRSLGAKPKAR